MARAAEAAVGPGGCLLESIYTRPCIEPSDLVCSCPMVCAVRLNRLMPLPVSDMTFSVSCHLNYAFVHLQLVCEVPSHAPVSRGTVYFFMPKAPDTTVTELRAHNMTTSKVYPSPQVVSEDVVRGQKRRVLGAASPEADTADMTADQSQNQGQLQAEQSELLRLDFHAERVNRLSVSLQYFHPLHFDASTGDYVLQLPTGIPQECLNGADVREILKVSVTVHTGNAAAAAVEPESNYPVCCLTAQGGAVGFRANKARVWPQQDLILRYQLPADNITADMQVLPNPNGGSFMLSLMPPDRGSALARRTFPRDVVFLFGRSSSINGNPGLAKAALMRGLQKTLQLQDRFTVAAFNEGQQWWHESLVDATPQNLDSCQGWVSEHITAKGQTDIRQPLIQALQLLRSAPPGAGAGLRLPTVFLVVDGPVKDEHDVCEQAQQRFANPPPFIQPGVPQQPPPRIFTFGIGSFCNHYFLKTLAVIGRGMYRGAFNPNSIQQVMSELLDAAAMPMLTNISVAGSDLACHYPAPIPDLCLGQSCVVAGEFFGHSPPVVSVLGLMTGHTAPVEVCVQPRPAQGTGLQYVLEKILAHQKLELMAAHAWRLCKYRALSLTVCRAPEFVSELQDWGLAPAKAAAADRLVMYGPFII